MGAYQDAYVHWRLQRAMVADWFLNHFACAGQYGG
jgi:hypothetical protein